MTEQTLDLHGAVCPDPLLQVQAAMGGLTSGGRLVVLVDYPLAVENIGRWAKGAGHPMDLEKTGPSAWKLTLVKT
jgi:TusA-related sulfurtransferase